VRFDERIHRLRGHRAYADRVDPGLRIVTRLPLTELWNAEGPVAAVELGALSEEEVRAKLRLGAVGVVASGGKPLRWLRGAELFEWWKVEARPRLVEPERTRRYDVPPRASAEERPGVLRLTGTAWRIFRASGVGARASGRWPTG
jgi:hypothetical protein